MTNPYARDVSAISTLDPYRLQELYKMHPCAEHVVKKLLVAGQREGGKDLDHDISDCIRTLTRWQEMRAEDKGTPLDTPSKETPASMYDWTLVDSRYNWIAQDSDEIVYAYSERPYYGPFSGKWELRTNNSAYVKRLPGFSTPVSACDSLEARP